MMSAFGALGLYGVSGLFKENNALVCLVSAGHYGCIDPNAEPKKEEKDATAKTENTKPNDAQSNGSALNTTSASEPNSSEKTEAEKQGTGIAGNPALNGVVPATAFPEQVYDPSKPYDYQPVAMPAVVNQRVFSGCVSFEGKHYAVDQQGTLIKQFSASDCKKLIEHSYNRPFDYFGNRNQPLVQQQQQSSYETSPEYQQALINAIAQKQADQIIRSQNAQVSVEPMQLNEPKPRIMESANRY